MERGVCVAFLCFVEVARCTPHSTLHTAVHIHTPHFTLQFTFTRHTLHSIHPTLHNLAVNSPKFIGQSHTLSAQFTATVHSPQSTVHTPAFHTPDICWISLLADDVRCSKLSKSLPTSLFTNPTFKKLEPSFWVQLSHFCF